MSERQRMANTNDATPSVASDNSQSAQNGENARSPGGSGSAGGGAGEAGPGAQQDPARDDRDASRTETEDDRTFSATERDMLLASCALATCASRRMIPCADIIAIDEQTTVADLMHVFNEAASRLPVYHETIDDPRGMVHVKDLRHLTDDPSPTDGVALIPAARLTMRLREAKLMRPVLNVPPTCRLHLLVRMQGTRNHIALVVDEYGGTDGLVTTLWNSSSATSRTSMTSRRLRTSPRSRAHGLRRPGAHARGGARWRIRRQATTPS